jgi:hypothetical protein
MYLGSIYLIYLGSYDDSLEGKMAADPLKNKKIFFVSRFTSPTLLRPNDRLYIL